MRNGWAGRGARILACIAAVGFAAPASRAADSVLGPEAAKTMPLADAHFHVMPWMDIAQVIGYMDRNGIRWAGGAAAVGPPVRDMQAIAALGRRYIRSTGQVQWLAIKRQDSVEALENAGGPLFKQMLASVETDLRDNGARAISEIHVNTLQSAANQIVYHKIDANAPTLKALLDLAAKYGRPLNLHAQWDDDTAREFQQLAESNRNARLILSHCGSFASASAMRELLEKNPNVYCDLSYRSPPQLKGRAIDRTVFDSALRSDWMQLIEDYPDRFTVGVDGVQSWGDYEATVRNIRFGLLANLSPAVAEKVAYRNAVAWFALE